jgi:hypothetical protein
MYTSARIKYRTYYTHYFKNDLLSKAKNFAFKMSFDMYSCTTDGKFRTQAAVVHLVTGHKTVAVRAMPTLNSE